MATRRANRDEHRGHLGKFLVSVALIALAASLSTLAGPFAFVATRFREGLLGLLPTVGVYVLNATHAIAFHQVNYASLISHILLLFSAMVSLIAGIALLLPRSKRFQIIELVLSPELEGREIANGSSR